jgi:hypothetical protein
LEELEDEENTKRKWINRKKRKGRNLGGTGAGRIKERR